MCRLKVVSCNLEKVYAEGTDFDSRYNRYADEDEAKTLALDVFITELQSILNYSGWEGLRNLVRVEVVPH